MCKGGFPSLRHNEISDITADLVSEVCHNVCTEPVLKPLLGKSLPTSSVCTDGARLDIAAFGVQGMRELSLMLGFLTPLPLQTPLNPLPLFIENMNGKRRENMIHMLERWNMVPSFHW